MKTFTPLKPKMLCFVMFLLLATGALLVLWGYPYVFNTKHYEAERYTSISLPQYSPDEDVKIQDIKENLRSSAYMCRPFECASNEEFYIKSCEFHIDKSTPHFVPPSTTTELPKNELCAVFKKWMKNDDRIKLSEPSPELPYIQLHFTIFDDYVSIGSATFFDSYGEKTGRKVMMENGLIMHSRKKASSIFIFDYMIRKIMREYE